MTCEEALILISGHLDQTNSPQEEAQLQLHLKTCPSCRSLFQEMTLDDQNLRAMEAQPPAHFCEDVMAAIRMEKAAPKKKRRIWPVAATAAAAALLLAIGVKSLPGFQAETADTAAAESMAVTTMETSTEMAVYDGSSTENRKAEEAILQEETEEVEADPDTVLAAEPAEESTLADASAEAEQYGTDDAESTGTVLRSAAAQTDPQVLADDRGADVAVTEDRLSELEDCSCEFFEDGSELYTLNSADAAAQLSETYGLELYQPEEKSEDEISYVLLLP